MFRHIAITIYSNYICIYDNNLIIILSIIRPTYMYVWKKRNNYKAAKKGYNFIFVVF